MEPFATLDDLQGRLEWDLDPGEQAIARDALEALSEDARFYARRDWPTRAAAPRQVFTLVIRAAARFMRNPDGYTQSRAGDETLAWTDRGENAGSPVFTKSEIAMLHQLGGGSRLQTAEVTAWRSQQRPVAAGLVPVDYGGDGFPMFSREDSPW
ncbi:hypothetical protein [Kineococcus esterisolvens]|uniref:hypothetical protein n=1 Tax=unclassified Kineococcus TaxID=2621656 RepID=UPI003D7DD6F4